GPAVCFRALAQDDSDQTRICDGKASLAADANPIEWSIDRGPAFQDLVHSIEIELEGISDQWKTARARQVAQLTQRPWGSGRCRTRRKCGPQGEDEPALLADGAWPEADLVISYALSVLDVKPPTMVSADQVAPVHFAFREGGTLVRATALVG